MRTFVTADNFTRAESDRYFAVAIDEGGLGRLYHHRMVMPVEHQTVVRANRDTLYSSGVFDLDAGPVTVTLPDAGGRFRSLVVIDEDEYVDPPIYDAGRYTFTWCDFDTRYVLFALRTLVDPSSLSDLDAAHALQDAVKIEQLAAGGFDVPEWDLLSQDRVRDALVTLGTSLESFHGAFGTRGQVDPVRHLIGSAVGWGGNPERDAMYLSVTPVENDGQTIHRLVVKDVPVDGFWSISVYNARGYFEPNPFGAYSLNDRSAVKAADGSVTVQFGGYDGVTPNCLPTVPGWNYTVRLYRPRAALLSGAWQFPAAQPVAW
jgi:hypothetical protein